MLLSLEKQNKLDKQIVTFTPEMCRACFKFLHFPGKAKYSKYWTSGDSKEGSLKNVVRGWTSWWLQQLTGVGCKKKVVLLFFAGNVPHISTLKSDLYVGLTVRYFYFLPDRRQNTAVSLLKTSKINELFGWGQEAIREEETFISLRLNPSVPIKPKNKTVTTTGLSILIEKPYKKRFDSFYHP